MKKFTAYLTLLSLLTGLLGIETLNFITLKGNSMTVNTAFAEEEEPIPEPRVMTDLYTFFSESGPSNLDRKNWTGGRITLSASTDFAKNGTKSLKLSKTGDTEANDRLSFGWNGNTNAWRKIGEISTAVSNAVDEGNTYFSFWYYIPTGNSWVGAAGMGNGVTNEWRWYAVKITDKNKDELDLYFNPSSHEFYMDDIKLVQTSDGGWPSAPTPTPTPTETPETPEQTTTNVYTFFAESANNFVVQDWADLGITFAKSDDYAKNGTYSCKVAKTSTSAGLASIRWNWKTLAALGTTVEDAVDSGNAYLVFWSYVPTGAGSYSIASSVSNGVKGYWEWKTLKITDKTNTEQSLWMSDNAWAFYLDDVAVVTTSDGLAPSAPTPPPPYLYTRLNNTGVSVPGGYEHHSYYSAYFNARVGYSIYLPPSYGSQPSGRYPVIYMMHGWQGDENGYDQSDIYKAYIENETYTWFKDFIIVNINGADYTWYADSKDGKYPMRSSVLNELIPHIDATYRTVADRNGRSLEGFSMGGYGALSLAFTRPDMFSRVLTYAAAVPRYVTSLGSSEAQSVMFGGDQAYYEYSGVYGQLERNADLIKSLGMTVRMYCGDGDHTLSYNTYMVSKLAEAGVALDGGGLQTIPGFTHTSGYRGSKGMDAMNFFNGMAGSGGGLPAVPESGTVIAKYFLEDNIRGGEYMTAVAQPDSVLKATYTVKNYNPSEDVDVTVIAAVFGSDGRLVSIGLAGDTVMPGDESAVYAEVSVPDVNDFYTVKTYLWDGNGNLTPLGAGNRPELGK